MLGNKSARPTEARVELGMCQQWMLIDTPLDRFDNGYCQKRTESTNIVADNGVSSGTGPRQSPPNATLRVRYIGASSNTQFASGGILPAYIAQAAQHQSRS